MKREFWDKLILIYYYYYFGTMMCPSKYLKSNYSK